MPKVDRDPAQPTTPPDFLTFANSRLIWRFASTSRFHPPRPLLLPKNLTLPPRCTKIRQKRDSCPVKSHPRWRLAPDMPHQRGLRTIKTPEKPGLGKSRKPSPVTDRHALPSIVRCRAVHSANVPKNLTFGITTLSGRLLNLLTFCPAPAHRASRTSSLLNPAVAHHHSRKASPHRSETPAW